MTMTVDDIIHDLRDTLSTQDYSPKPRIDDVDIIALKTFSDDGGNFLEVVRFDDGGNLQGMPPYQPRQLSYTTLEPGAIKAWHLHYKQDDLWFVPPDSKILIGLVDTRNESPTSTNSMRFVLGDGVPRLLFIPCGVAHGMANLTAETQRVMYFTNQHFDPEDPDEHRLPWDHFGAEFWEMTRG